MLAYIEPRIETFVPATEPLDPRRVSERVSEGFFEGLLKGSAEGPFKTHSKENPSTTLQEGVEMDNALGFPGL